MFFNKYLVKICRICNNERQKDKDHRLNKRCNKCKARFSSNFSYTNIDKKLDNRKKYYNNREKFVDLEKNRHNVHKKELDELYIKIENLTHASEMLKTTISAA